MNACISVICIVYLISQPSPTSQATVPIITIPTSSLDPQPTRSRLNNFEVPSRWRPSIMNVIKKKLLTSEVRNEISRDLITLLYIYETDPGAADCKRVASLLVAKYPFMADGPETSNNKAVRFVVCAPLHFCVLPIGILVTCT